MAEFFAMEAGEYLERLDGLVSASSAPNAEEFIRLSRALRGSALMANQQPIAAAAGGLEALARALRQGKVTWDPGNKQLAIRSVDDLKILVRSVATWTPREDARARGLANELEQVAGVRTSQKLAAVHVGDTGTRAFVGREGAALAGALDRAAQMLSQNSSAVDQIQTVLQVMQPLRGLAGLADLPPLPDVLDGVQRAVAEVTRRKDAAPGAVNVFRAAARTLARASREVTTGTPTPDSPELADFASELGRLLESEKDVVGIESLFFTDQGPHIVERGSAPAPGANAQAELVSHGGHLRQVADGLDAATSDAQRALRVQSLAGTLTALATAGFGMLTQAIRDVASRGAIQKNPGPVAASLREAGAILSKAAQTEIKLIEQELEPVVEALRAAAARPSPPASQRAPVTVETPVPASTANQGDEEPGLLGSLLRFQRFVTTFGTGKADLGELLAGPPAFLTGGASVSSDHETVSIDALCFSGPAALARALSLRDQVRSALARHDGGAEARELLEEIFDLVKLGQNTN